MNSDYAKINRYDSFAPSRQNCQAQFYADGADYFRDMAEALLTAQNEVLITDWWLSP
jgi:phospholipase D1/2